jgi:tetratricopeptide (TPR) repeat protein
MVKAWDSINPKVNETGNIIHDTLEKVAQALEMERNKLREQADRDSNQLIAKAREEADNIINQARQKAKFESDNLIAKLKEETNQAVLESRDKALLEAQQKSASVINETIEKTKQIIKEFFERYVEQAKSEFVQVASDAKSKLENERANMLAISKRIEDIIDETEIKIQTRSEHLATAIAETEEKLRAVNEAPHQEAAMSFLQIDVIKDKKLQMVKVTPPNGTAINLPKVAQENRKTELTNPRESSQTVEFLMQEGISLLDSNKNVKAIENFTKVIELDPQNALAWRKKGTALGILSRHYEALEAFERATQLDPDDVTAWHNMEIVLKRLGRKKEAEEAKKAEKRAKKETERSAKL